MNQDILTKDYKLLDLDKDATVQDARRAYHRMKALYAESSLATYNLMPVEERAEKLDAIERAYMRICMEIESRSPTHGSVFIPAQAVPPEPPEPGESIGGYLKRCREHLGLTIRDIAAKTRIRTTYLENIENDHISNLPATVYLRGFVLEFARALELRDPEAIAAAYLKRFEREDR